MFQLEPIKKLFSPNLYWRNPYNTIPVGSSSCLHRLRVCGKLCGVPAALVVVGPSFHSEVASTVEV